MINSSLTISTLFSIAVAVIFVLGLNIWSPALLSLKQNSILFVLFVVFTVATAANLITDNVFVAERRAGLTTARTAIFNLLKLILVFLLAGIMKSHGIFNSWGISLMFSLFLGLIIFLPRIHRGYFPHPDFQWQETTELIRYSVLNNIGVILWSIPTWTLPLIILNRLGPEANAYFYIGWTIGTALATIPSSVAVSLFAEGSHEEKDLISKTIRTLSLIVLVLIPIAALMIILGHRILRLFGAGYAENATFELTMMILALFPIVVNQLYFSVLRVQKKLVVLTVLMCLITSTTLVLSILLIPFQGIQGASFAWFTGQTIVALWILSKEGWWKPLLRQMLNLLLLKGAIYERK